MKVGRKINHTRFVPIFFDRTTIDFSNVNIEEIANKLRDSESAPYLILFSHEIINFPPLSELIIEKRNFIIPSHEFITENTFLEFKSLIASIYAQSYESKTNSLIGIASVGSHNLLGYFIVRWIIEEKMFSFEFAHNLFTESEMRPISNDDFIKTLTNISNSRQTVDPQEKKFENLENDYMGLLKLLETSNEHAPVQPTPVAQINKPITNYQFILREMNIKLKILQKNIPKFGQNILMRNILSYFTHKPDNIAVTINPEGTHGFLYAKTGEKVILCDNGLVISTYLHFPQPNNPNQQLKTTIFEGYFVNNPETFIVCDTLIFNGENVRSEPFDVRIGYLTEYLFEERAKYPQILQNESIKLMVRPFFPFKSINQLLKKIDSIVPYKVDGVSIGPLSASWSQDKKETGWYQWKINLPKPTVILSLNYANNELCGMMSMHGGLAKALSLGIIDKSSVQLDGAVAQIAFDTASNKFVLNQIPSDESVWSFEKFEEAFPVDETPIPYEVFVQLTDGVH